MENRKEQGNWGFGIKQKYKTKKRKFEIAQTPVIKKNLDRFLTVVSYKKKNNNNNIKIKKFRMRARASIGLFII